MYSKEEAKRLKENFWTSFGQYMSLVPSADGEKVNWVNYKTGVKSIFFRMDATNKSAHIFIEINHSDAGIRQLIFEQFKELRNVLHATVEEDWDWDDVYYDESGKYIARIGVDFPSKISIYNKEHWADLISFFKVRIMALDEFWSSAKYSFDIFK